MGDIITIEAFAENKPVKQPKQVDPDDPTTWADPNGPRPVVHQLEARIHARAGANTPIGE